VQIFINLEIEGNATHTNGTFEKKHKPTLKNVFL